MIKQLLLLFIVLFLISCIPTPATEQQKKDAMRNAKFDQSIIKHLSKYEHLKTFLENNCDAIIKYRYCRNKATLLRGKGQLDSNYLADDNCYNFFQGNNYFDITNVPDNLKVELDSLFHTFNSNEINSFRICKDKKITIEVRSEGGESGLYISHNLMWNTRIERDYTYSDNKDTLLNNMCIYRIGLIEHYGH